MPHVASTIVAFGALLATASAFVPLPHAPARPASRVRPSPIQPLPQLAVPLPLRHAERHILRAAVSANSPTLSGLEYIAFGFLYFWGCVCVAINTFLWVFRWSIEKSGFAPSSWYNAAQKAAKAAKGTPPATA